MGEHPHEEDRPKNVTTWLVIPYFDGDVGRPGIERPVPAHLAISWLCRSIVVNGVPGGTGFKRGEPFTVAVDVANWGAGALPVPAWLRLWWADPTLAFASATLCGQTSVVVPPNGKPVRTEQMTVTVPEGASPHVCLLAHVAAPLDGTTTSVVPNPHADRKWAQLNLLEVADVTADGVFTLEAWLGNPFAEPTPSTATIEVIVREQARLLSATLGHDLITDNAVESDIRDRDGNDALRTELKPFESRPVTLGGRLANPLERGQWVALSLGQRLGDDAEHPALIGNLGILIERRGA